MIILFFIIIQVKESKWEELSPPKLKFSINFIYDDNIFKYSQSDIDNFLNNRKRERFLNVESYDDFITNVKLRLKINSFYFNYFIYHYAVNNIKNYQVINFRMDWKSCKFGYILVPQYHIRNYYDTEFDKFMRCDFRQHKIFFEAKAHLKVSPTLIYNFVYYDYNNYFNEYDTRANIFGIKLEEKFIPKAKLSIKYIYEMAKSDWRNKPKEPDLSYNQHSVDLDVSYKVIKDCKIKIGYCYEYRIYTSKKPIEIDPFHRNRKDNIQNFCVGIDKEITKNLAAEIKYEYEKRGTHSPMKEKITEVKDYKRNRIYIGLNIN